MPLLGLLWGASGLTSVGRYLIIGVAGLFALGLLVNGIVAPYKREISSLRAYNKQLEQAAEKSAKILAEDSELAEAQALSRAAFDAEAQKVRNESNVSPDTCRLSPERLRQLRKLAARIN